MKRNLIKIFAVVLAICSLALVGCAKKPSGCEHQFESYKYVADGDKAFKQGFCQKCQQPARLEIAVAGVIDDGQALSVLQAQSNFADNSTILIKQGSYDLLYLTNDAVGTKLVCEDGVTVKVLRVSRGASDLYVENMKFTTSSGASRVEVVGEVSGLTLKNCLFEGYAQVYNYSHMIGDLVIDGCTFKNLVAPEGSMKLSAILVRQYSGLTITNCVFDNVQYNAMQVGAVSGSGDVVIKNNVFKDIGDKVVYLVKSEPNSCDISGNIFYDNSDCTNAGAYVASTGYGRIEVGVNTWEVIPEAIDKYFYQVSSGRVIYNVEEQIQLAD